MATLNQKSKPGYDRGSATLRLPPKQRILFPACSHHAQALKFVALYCRCVIVGSLEVVYRLPTASGITISQPQPRAAALQDSDLFVEVDKLDSYTHILPELTRLFAKGAVEPELAQFLVALTLTMVRLMKPPYIW